MSFRSSSEEMRWLVISKYNEMKKKNPRVSASKIYNKLRFTKHKSITYIFVVRTINRYKTTGKTCDTPQKTKKRKIDDAIKSSVVKHATSPKKPKHQRSTRQVAKSLHGKRGNKRKISHMSVSNILRSCGKRYKRPKRVPLITPHHKRMKRLWAKQYAHDTVEDWKSTLAIDETHYETFHKTNRQNSGSWVDADEEPEKEQTVKHPGRVSASTGVCGSGAADVDLYTDKFNQKKFLDVHLKKKYVPAMQKFNCTRLLMDNDGSHHAKTCVKWMMENSVNFSAAPPRPCGLKKCRCKPPEGWWFPAYAPEVSPAELYNNYIQEELDKFTEKNGHPNSTEILRRRVRQIVRKTSASYFKSLMEGMPGRVKQMFKDNGGRGKI